MIKVKYWEVWDFMGVDGRGGKEVVGRFTNKKDAETFSINAGNYAQKAKVDYVEYTIAESIEEIKNIKHQEQLKKVQEKYNRVFSEEERNLLEGRS